MLRPRRRRSAHRNERAPDAQPGWPSHTGRTVSRHARGQPSSDKCLGGSCDPAARGNPSESLQRLGSAGRERRRRPSLEEGRRPGMGLPGGVGPRPDRRRPGPQVPSRIRTNHRDDGKRIGSSLCLCGGVFSSGRSRSRLAKFQSCIPVGLVSQRPPGIVAWDCSRAGTGEAPFQPFCLWKRQP
jgi:hypothetical protein